MRNSWRGVLGRGKATPPSALVPECLLWLRVGILSPRCFQCHLHSLGLLPFHSVAVPELGARSWGSDLPGEQEDTKTERKVLPALVLVVSHLCWHIPGAAAMAVLVVPGFCVGVLVPFSIHPGSY